MPTQIDFDQLLDRKLLYQIQNEAYEAKDVTTYRLVQYILSTSDEHEQRFILMRLMMKGLVDFCKSMRDFKRFWIDEEGSIRSNIYDNLIKRFEERWAGYLEVEAPESEEISRVREENGVGVRINRRFALHIHNTIGASLIESLRRDDDDPNPVRFYNHVMMTTHYEKYKFELTIQRVDGKTTQETVSELEEKVKEKDETIRQLKEIVKDLGAR